METLAQLQSWQKQAIGNEKASANMDVALRLLRHGAEAIAEIERLRAELAELRRFRKAIMDYDSNLYDALADSDAAHKGEGE